MPFDDPVARVDRRALADLDIPRLGLGDLQLRLQLVPLDDLGERRPGSHALARLHRHFLEDAGDARPHAQRVHLRPLQARERPLLLDPRVLRLDLRLLRLGVDGEAFLLDLVAGRELLGPHFRKLQGQARDEPLLEEPPVGLRLQLRLVEVGLDGRRGRLLIEQLLAEADLRVREIGLSGLQLPVRVERVPLELGVGHFQDHRIGRDIGARLDQEALDARVRRGGDLADPLGLGHERAGAANLPLHRAALDDVDQDRALVHRWRRRLQPRQAERDEKDRGHARARQHEPALLLLLRDVFPNDVHDSVLIRARNMPRPSRLKSLVRKRKTLVLAKELGACGNPVSGNEQWADGYLDRP